MLTAPPLESDMSAPSSKGKIDKKNRISDDDYYLKNREFRVWLKESK